MDLLKECWQNSLKQCHLVTSTKGWVRGKKWLALLPHWSLVMSWACLSVCVEFYMLSPCLYRFPRTFQKHASRSTGYFKTTVMPLGVKERMHGALQWIGVFPDSSQHWPRWNCYWRWMDILMDSGGGHLNISQFVVISETKLERPLIADI